MRKKIKIKTPKTKTQQLLALNIYGEELAIPAEQAKPVAIKRAPAPKKETVLYVANNGIVCHSREECIAYNRSLMGLD